MKMLCLSEDESLGKRVCDEADRLSWAAVYIRDRENINQAMREYDPDLLLVEVKNVAALEWWKHAGISPSKPVIFLNGEMSEEYMSQALNIGADAFIPKALFSPRHFEANIRALIRRQALGQSKRFISRLNVMIDNERYSIEVSGKLLDLTLTEFKILRELASEQLIVVSRSEIQTRVFGQATLSNRSLDVHICAVRKKVKPFNLDIDSVRSVGYRLVVIHT